MRYTSTDIVSLISIALHRSVYPLTSTTMSASEPNSPLMSEFASTAVEEMAAHQAEISLETFRSKLWPPGSGDLAEDRLKHISDELADAFRVEKRKGKGGLTVSEASEIPRDPADPSAAKHKGSSEVTKVDISNEATGASRGKKWKGRTEGVKGLDTLNEPADTSQAEEKEGGLKILREQDMYPPLVR